MKNGSISQVLRKELFKEIPCEEKALEQEEECSCIRMVGLSSESTKSEIHKYLISPIFHPSEERGGGGGRL